MEFVKTFQQHFAANEFTCSKFILPHLRHSDFSYERSEQLADSTLIWKWNKCPKKPVGCHTCGQTFYSEEIFLSNELVGYISLSFNWNLFKKKVRALDNATEMAVDGSFVADRPFTSEHSAVRCSCTGSTFHLLLVARDFISFFFLHVARGGCCWLLLKKFFENQPTRRTLLQHRPIVWNGSINRKLTASFGESRNVSKEQNPPKGQRCLTHTHTLSKGKISFGKTTGKPRAGERGGINKFRIFTRPTQKHFFFFSNSTNRG